MKAIIYLLQVSACTGIFYLFYFVLLRRLTFFTLNRWYLLGTLLLNFIIPAISLPVSITQPVAIMQPVMYLNRIQVIEEPVELINQPQKLKQQFDWIASVKTVYVVIAIISVIHLLFTLLIFARKMRNKELMQIGNVRVLKGSKKLGNSSFLNVIFINDDELEPSEIKQIIAHEMLHVKLMHSADRLLARVILIVLWFNPFAYFYIRSIEENHEFEVDHIATGNTDKSMYATLLFKLSVSGQSYLMHSFSKVPLKSRIAMLFNKPTSNMKKIIYMLVLPVVAISCLAFANLKPNNQKEHRFANKSTVDTTIIDTVKTYRQKIKRTPAQKLAYEKSIADFKAYTKSADHKYKNALARRVHMQTLSYKVVGTIDTMYGPMHLTGYKLTQGADEFVVTYNYNNKKTLKGLFKAGDEIQLKSIGEMWLKSIPVIVEPALITKDNKVIFQPANASQITPVSSLLNPPATKKTAAVNAKIAIAMDKADVTSDFYTRTHFQNKDGKNFDKITFKLSREAGSANLGTDEKAGTFIDGIFYNEYEIKKLSPEKTASLVFDNNGLKPEKIPEGNYAVPFSFKTKKAATAADPTQNR
ncbi:M56 family metallopeptidase [Mucilaginibacter sp.]|uniref:M56 family metallopeptidase n=1 Tax=Mucilaginibacter sp. TaxID=1882438 RepID=UPI002636CB3C|nr:M56 family metallopeptidase [Mucilaginibacter sp.]MDB5126913.1 hypothetical protein [Mucilaginibacter sp.]